VSVRRGQVVLERIGQAGLPDGAVVDGEVNDPAAVATAIKDLWRRTRISSRRVIIGVANQRVVVRLVDLPWMQPSELRSSLGFQAGDYLPIPVDQTELDHAVIGEHGGPAASACCARSARWPGSRRAPRRSSTSARA
jgi:type IV pilus assembly protein PilM